MEKPIYGVINSKGCHVDTLLTLHGAKCYATRHGYNEVSKRIGYDALVIARKLTNGKWDYLPLPF